MSGNNGIPIKGTAKGSAGAAFTIAKRRGAQRLDFTRDYFVSLYAVCKTLGINADVLVAQWSEETGDGTSAYWLNDGNPAGIAAFDDGSNWGLTFTPEKAAGAQAVHMCRYLGMTVSSEMQKLDARWQAVADAGYVGKVTTTADLGNGLWATNPSYAKNLVERYIAYWGDYTDAISVPTPLKETPVSDTVNKIIDKLVDITGKEAELNFDSSLVPLPKHDVVYAWNKVEGVGTNFMGPRTFRGNTFHRCLSDGQTFEGAVDWLLRASTAGLADGFIDHRTGQMRFINPMRALASTFSFKMDPNWDDQAGWTNGPYQSGVASDDAKAFVAAYGGRLGANIINQDCENVEITGDYDDPISDACKETIVQWQASRAQLLKIPYSSYPINPATGLTMIYGHREWCGTDYKLCPGSVVWAFMNGPMIGLVQARLKAAQTSGIVVRPQPEPIPQIPNTAYAKPQVPEWVKTWKGEPVLKNVQGVVGNVYATTAQYVADKDTPRLQYATSGSKRVGPDIKKGEDFPVAFIFTAQDGKEYGMTWYGTRTPLVDLKVVGDNALKAA